MHLAPDELALASVGRGDPASQRHLQSCPTCRDEAESLGEVSAILSGGGPMPVEAPDHLWLSIAAAIEAPPATLTPIAGVAPAEMAPAPVESLNARRTPTPADRSAHRRRSFSGLSLLGAAAAGAAVMWVGSMALSGTDEPAQTVLATATLEPLESSVAAGQAEIIEREGQRVLRVDTDSLPEVQDGYLQVWLLGDDLSGMVTLGALGEVGEEFVLPPGLSTETYATVDVSVEHYDGDPTHSGESLWRGPIALG